MKDWLIKKLGFPSRSIVNRRIPKKTFFNQGLSSKVREMFTSQIEGIFLLSISNQDVMNLPPYKDENRNYSEVFWIYLELRTTKNIHRIIEAVHETLPNPSVLILYNESSIMISTCHKRLNKNNEHKVVIDTPINTPWFTSHVENEEEYLKLLNLISVSNLSLENMYLFYDDLQQWLICTKMIPLLGRMPGDKGNRKLILENLNEIENYQQTINHLKSRQKEELEFGVKMEFHINIKHFENKKKQHLQVLKELC